jgi:hypothetical protein
MEVYGMLATETESRGLAMMITVLSLQWRSAALSALLFGLFLVVWSCPGQAQPPPTSDLNAPPKVLELLQAKVRSPQVSQAKPSAESLTVPGLWWADQLFGDKMVMSWSAYRRSQAMNSQVRAIVRPDLWSRYTYLERYAFLRRFGATTSAAGYHLLVLDRRDYPLGAYTCEFSATTKPSVLYPWLRQTNDLIAQSASSLPPQPACNAWVSPVYSTSFF